MRKIEALVHAESFNATLEALTAAHLGPCQTTEVRLFDPALHPDHSYRGVAYSVGRLRVRIDLVVADDEVDLATDALRTGAERVGMPAPEVVVLDVVEIVQRETPSLIRERWRRVRARAR